MNKEQILKYYGTHTKACRAINLPPQTYYQWVRQGYISINSQFKFERASNNILTADCVDYLNVMRKKFNEENNIKD